MAIPAVPQEPAPQGPVIKSQVSLVNVFVTVRDKSKRIVGDLKQQDFKLEEDSQDQKIAFFSKEVNLPITLALLLDTSGSEQEMLGAIQSAGSQFLDRVLRKGDEALVMSFDTDVDLLSDFTDNRAQLDRAVRRARINTPGGGMIAGNPGPIGNQQMIGTALYDAHLSGVQRKTQYRSRAQSHRAWLPTRRMKAAKSEWKRRLNPLRERMRSPHFAGSGPAIRRRKSAAWRKNWQTRPAGA